MLEKLIGYGLQLLSLVIKPLASIVPPEFVSFLDGATSFLLELLAAASWLVPMDVLVVCLSVMVIVDNYKLFVRLSKYLISFIPGVG